MSAATLVIMAKRLECQYPGDPCERHDGSNPRYKAEDGFRTCTPCQVRREAERVDRTLPRPPAVQPEGGPE